MGKTARFKYPKFTVLFFMFVAAYIIFSGRSFAPLHDFLISLEYAGAFIAGVMYSYGLTGAPAAAVFIIISSNHDIFITALVGGLGSLFTDLVIFKLVRHSLTDEVERLTKEKFVVSAGKKIPRRLRRPVLTVLACFIIASPLPDEIGVSMLACEKWISEKVFTALSFILNTAGILVILYIGTMI